MVDAANALVNKSTKVEISANGTSWTDISGYATNIDPGEMLRTDGGVFVFAADKGQVTTGKLAIREVALDLLYTEGLSDAFKLIRAAIESDLPYYLRWSPQGGSSGDFLFTSDVGKFLAIGDPTSAADSPDGVIVAATFKTGFVTLTAIA